MMILSPGEQVLPKRITIPFGFCVDKFVLYTCHEFILNPWEEPACDRASRGVKLLSL